MNNIILRRGKEESLKRFHPWIFSGAILRADGPLQEGDLVLVRDSEGREMGIGHYKIGSIAVRMLHDRPFSLTAPATAEKP